MFYSTIYCIVSGNNRLSTLQQFAEYWLVTFVHCMITEINVNVSYRFNVSMRCVEIIDAISLTCNRKHAVPVAFCRLFCQIWLLLGLLSMKTPGS